MSPTGRHRLATSIGEWEEALIVELRQSLALPLDDIVEAMRRCLNPNLSRSGIHRCLKRHGLSARLTPQQAPAAVFQTDTPAGFAGPRTGSQPAQLLQAVVVDPARHVVERVSEEMHLAALIGRLRHNLAQRCPQAGMIIGHDEFDAVQTARLEPQQAIGRAITAGG
jgi:hypothetical protein